MDHAAEKIAELRCELAQAENRQPPAPQPNMVPLLAGPSAPEAPPPAPKAITDKALREDLQTSLLSFRALGQSTKPLQQEEGAPGAGPGSGRGRAGAGPGPGWEQGRALIS